MSEAVCLSHRVDISDKARKKFTTPFIETVRHLYIASMGDEEQKIEAFKNLVNEFGTHYAAITDLGTKLSIERRYSAKERASSGTNEISQCNTLVGSQIFGFQTEMGRYNCTKDNLIEKGRGKHISKTLINNEQCSYNRHYHYRLTL